MCKYMNKNNIDLIFLDIHLPKMSGMEFLKSTPNHPLIIMTTAFPDYALESYICYISIYLTFSNIFVINNIINICNLITF